MTALDADHAVSDDAGAGADTSELVGWAAAATSSDWRDLAAWVDWLIVTYDVVPSTALLACWPVHTGVVEEIAALRSAWRAAIAVTEDDSELAYWHDRLLHPFLQRARTVYSMRQCADGHKAPVARRLTSSDLLAQAAATAAREVTLEIAIPPPGTQ